MRLDRTIHQSKEPSPPTISPVEAAKETAASDPAWRLIGTSFLGLLIPTLLFISLMFVEARFLLKKQAVRQNALATQLAARATEEHFTGLAHYLESFARRSTVSEALRLKNENALRAHLRELVLENSEFDRAFVSDANGIELSDYPPAPGVVGQSFAFRDWFQGAFRGRQTYVSEIYQRTAEPRRFLTAIAVPIPGREGAPVGFLVGQHTIESLSAWFAQIRPLFAGRLLLVDQHGHVATEMGLAEEPPLNLGDDPLIQEALTGSANSQEKPDPVTGEKSLISYVAIRSIGWSVLAVLPLDQVFVPFRTLWIPFLILTAVFLVGLFAVHLSALHLVHRYHRAEKEAESALRASEEKLRAVVQTARDAVISANQFGEIIFWNRYAETMFGYTEAEALGKPLLLLMPERFREAHRQGLARFLFLGEPRLIGKIVELAGLHKDGTEFPLELSLSHWMFRDEHYFTAILRDITERKRDRDELLAKNRELEKVAQELRERTERLQRFHNLAVDRELDMQKLKQEANGFLEELGKPKKY